MTIPAENTGAFQNAAWFAAHLREIACEMRCSLKVRVDRLEKFRQAVIASKSAADLRKRLPDSELEHVIRVGELPRPSEPPRYVPVSSEEMKGLKDFTSLTRMARFTENGPELAGYAREIFPERGVTKKELDDALLEFGGREALRKDAKAKKAKPHGEDRNGSGAEMRIASIEERYIGHYTFDISYNRVPQVAELVARSIAAGHLVSLHKLWRFVVLERGLPLEFPDDRIHDLRLFWYDRVLTSLMESDPGKFVPEEAAWGSVMNFIAACDLLAQLIEGRATDALSVAEKGAASADHTEMLAPIGGTAATPSAKAQAEWPPDDGWHFRPGKFAFLRQEHALTGNNWRLLKAFVETPLARTPSELSEAISTEYSHNDGTIRGYLTNLRNALRQAFSLPEKYDPIPSVDRGDLLAWAFAKDLADRCRQCSAAQKQRKH